MTMLLGGWEGNRCCDVISSGNWGRKVEARVSEEMTVSKVK
jgi:hypothetical protein